MAIMGMFLLLEFVALILLSYGAGYVVGRNIRNLGATILIAVLWTPVLSLVMGSLSLIFLFVIWSLIPFIGGIIKGRSIFKKKYEQNTDSSKE